MLRRLVLAALALLVLAAPAGAQTFANPVIDGDHPDPTVLAFEGRFYAASTVSAWAPLFPIFRSDDLVSWREVGAVLDRAPSWGAGRFWAPELTIAPGGGVIAYWSSSSRFGKPCIGAATAPRPEGPWRDRGVVACPPGGAIDAAPVTDEQGRRWLGWKQLGVGGGIHLQRLSADGLRASGPAPELIRPDQPWERGVTEGAAFVRRDGWWYLLYSGGNCCRPPCTYAEGVARSRTLAGPYEKRGAPILRGNAAFRCPGHGTPVDLGERGVFLLHHGYRFDDRQSLRRVALLDRIRFGVADGWPQIDGPAHEAPAPFAAPQRRTTPGWSDGFGGRALGPGWQWLWNRPPPRSVTAGRLGLACEAPATRPAFVARKSPVDRFAAVAQLRAARGATAFLAVHDHDGVLRGLARRADGVAYAFSVSPRGVLRRGPVRRGAGARVVVSGAPGGAVGLQAGGITLPAGPAAAGAQATRVALGCWGGGRASFAFARLRALTG